jgi:rubrerythrin
MAINTERQIIAGESEEPLRNEPNQLLRQRFRLEPTSAENYLELAHRTGDDHTKLLLRMIASDSIRHGDVVSQVISWPESDCEKGFQVPARGC